MHALTTALPPSSPQVSDKASRFDPRNEPRVLGCSLYAPPHAHAHAHAPHAHGALTTALAQPSPSHTSPAALTTALGDACGDSGRRGERAHARTDGCAVHWSVDAEGQAMDVVHALLLGEDARVCGSLACPTAKHASAHHGAPLSPQVRWARVARSCARTQSSSYAR